MTTSLLLSKIISLSDARSRKSSASIRRVNDDHEQRREFRRESNDRLFLQIVKSDDEELIGTTLSCQAVDVSGNGLKVACDQYIPVGCVLDLWVDDTAQPGKFFLSSEVRWVTEDRQDFQIGVQLLESAATDIQAWQQRQA